MRTRRKLGISGKLRKDGDIERFDVKDWANKVVATTTLVGCPFSCVHLLPASLTITPGMPGIPGTS
jgi:hypothetical protein